MKARNYIWGLFCLCTLFSPLSAAAQPTGTLFLSADSLAGGVLDLYDLPWRFHAGEDPAWADLTIDDLVTQAYGGATIEGTPNGGTTFIVTLPGGAA